MKGSTFSEWLFFTIPNKIEFWKSWFLKKNKNQLKDTEDTTWTLCCIKFCWTCTFFLCWTKTVPSRILSATKKAYNYIYTEKNHRSIFWMYWKSPKEFSSLEKYQVMQKIFKGFTAKICGLSLLAIFTLWVFTLWHITLVLYSKRKSSISAPADKKVISKQARLNATKSVLVIIIGQGKSLLRHQIT